jgi:tetratricopeptide (TPR) repeat protein
VELHPVPPPPPFSEAVPPPPPAVAARSDRAGYEPRHWPKALLAIGAIVTAAIGVVVGAAASTAAAASAAATLAAHGYYASAISIDEAISVRTGPVFVLDTGDAATANRAAQQTLMAWAAALGRAGKVDQAVALYRSVTAPSLRKQALDDLAALLFKTSTSDAAIANYSSAILRLQEIARLAPSTPAGIAAARQLPADQAGEAGLLVTAGRATDAVTILDGIAAEHSAPATRTADSLFPSALLAAGVEDLAQDFYREALADLQQLVTDYPASAEAAQAHAMIVAPETVTGTLVTHIGGPVSGRVRLSSNYESEPNGMYRTSAPFFYTTADASGDFTFTNVPIGGPYVLEVFADGTWTTLINPNTQQPADPVIVTALLPVNLTFVVLPS